MPSKSAAQRLRQGALPDTLKKSIAAYLAPKTPSRVLDGVLAYTHQRLTTAEPGVGWVFLRIRPGIEIEVFRRNAPHAHYRMNIYLNARNPLVGGVIEREATRHELLPLTEKSVLQILYIIRSVLTKFALMPMPDIVPYQNDRIRRATMFRALDVLKPSPSTEKTLRFIEVFRT